MSQPYLPIDPRSLSFEEISRDLQEWLQSKPQSWRDFYIGSDGRIIAEWVAGLAAFRAYQEMARRREDSLDAALLPSSVYNIAFRRGLLVAPSSTAHLTLTLSSSSDTTIERGQLIATIDAYDVFAYESKAFLANTQTELKCVVGKPNIFQVNLAQLPQFKMLTFNIPNQFIATELEYFLADGDPVKLQSDPQYIAEVKNDFVLRRILPNQVRIYVGNGVLGWHQPSTTQLEYYALSYDDDLRNRLDDIPRLLFDNLTLHNRTITQTPSYGPDIEEIRSLARYYPLDGRIVNDADYEAVIKKFYGGFFRDIYSRNIDPAQEVHFIAETSLGTGAVRQNNLDEISSKVDSTRTLGIPVYYYPYELTEGQALSVKYKVPRAAFSNNLITNVRKYLDAKRFKFARKNTTTTDISLGVELSAHFGVPFQSERVASVTLNSTDFFSTISVEVIPD